MRGLALAAAAALAVTLAGCGQTGVAGEGASTTITTPTPVSTPTPSDAALKALVSVHRAGFVKAARRFARCDGRVTYDSYSASPCLASAAAVTAEVNSFVGDLRSLPTPASSATLIADLKAISTAGAKVAVRCANRNDQPCDQALARFRADQQSVLWDLNASL